MKDTEKLLARMSNLISEDSTILRDYENKINRATKDKEKAEEARKKIETDITDIQGDIDSITKASELSDRFDKLDDYELGLSKLGGAVEYIKKIQEELSRIPEKIEELENRINDLNEKSTETDNTIKADEDELSKLDVELSDAKRYQANLIDLVSLAKAGDINKTREEVVETLKHVGFNEKDSLSAAKLILFPEDDLIPYFEKNNNKEKAKEEQIKIEEPIAQEIAEEKEIVEEEEEDIEKPTIEIEEEPVEEEEEDISIKVEETIDPKRIIETEDSVELLESLGLDVHKFSPEDLESLNDGDNNVIRENVDFLLDNNIEKDFMYSYPSIITDKELIGKYQFIIDKLGKEEEDIKLNPLILISYSLSDFEKLENVASRSGIDPKSIPLMVYIKGLQSFLQNYLLLKNNNVEIDDNELSKIAPILTIDPIEFKKSLDLILSYGISLKKSNGKYSVMSLSRNAKDLASDIDLIVETGEKDLLRYYPEVLNSSTFDLANRLVFIKKAGIPFKATAHGDIIYQSYVLSQEKLNKIVGKEIEINEIPSKDKTNEEAKELIKNEEVFNILDNMTSDDVIDSIDSKEYEKVISNYKHIDEKENFYSISNSEFSKNKVRRNINFLVKNHEELDNNIILLASLFHDSRKNKDEMNKVIATLGIKLG